MKAWKEYLRSASVADEDFNIIKGAGISEGGQLEG